MTDLGKYLVVAGLALAVVGVLLWTGFGRGWLGQLPGDIHIERERWSLRFPIVTCVLISAVLTLVMWFFRR